MGPWELFFLQLFFFLLFLRFLSQLSKVRKPRATVIVMGSGGHTAEMLRSLSTLEYINQKLKPRHYIIANTDSSSEYKVKQFESKIPNNVVASSSSSTTTTPNYYIHYIPRSREVGQSYVTSVFSTLRALFVSAKILWNTSPSCILANGPGTCLPICITAWIYKVIGILPHVHIALSESYACVSHPSLTTKLLYYFVNTLYVQWPNLLIKYPNAIYAGRFPINNNNNNNNNNKKDGQTKSIKSKKTTSDDDKNNNNYVLITVGTTKFDELIRSIDSVQFGQILKKKGYKGVHIQYGGSKEPKHIINTSNFECQIFDYRPSLIDEIKNASLIIGHAGVGTIFEALEHEKDTIIVPNPKLMNNHQAEITDALVTMFFLRTTTTTTCRTMYTTMCTTYHVNFTNST
eukprot:TRINITY_DN3922_c0_g1_i1.p1 TRINITY_DN3922_c0_g1~~TRINITY_DN3922_c0_g1_i1.p1  ORF type:complete len:403 (-),score=64.04 TRINITY_DN3922_c0_g1_i1:276-1484(-)